METLTLNDGTVLNGHLIETDGRLFLYVYDLSMAEVFTLLIQPAKTEKIIANRNKQEQVVMGYRKLVSVSDEGGGMISGALKKN